LNVQENSNNSVSIIGTGIAVSNVSGNTTTNVNADQVYITDGGSGGTNIMAYNTNTINYGGTNSMTLGTGSLQLTTATNYATYGLDNLTTDVPIFNINL
jgi:hypothetical protein